MTTMTNGSDSGATYGPAGGRPSGGRGQLRRSTDDRVVAGVAGGLGEYFGVDPVLFRLLFGVSTFFGGVGIIGYLFGWLLVPEPGAEHVLLDRLTLWLRRRHVPLWLVVGVAVILVWTSVFSWWAPWPSAPIAILGVLLIVVLSRKKNKSARSWGYPADPPSPVAETVNGTESEPASVLTESPQLQQAATNPWLPETRAWATESWQRCVRRRRRAAPVRRAALGALVATLAGLAPCDALTGIVLPVYFWVTVGIVLAALITGLVLRRTPWSLLVLLAPALVGLIAFGDTGASLHDGAGDVNWTPVTAQQLDSSYRLAFGQGVLDLRGLKPLSDARTVNITMAAGQVQILLPADLNASVHARVRMGTVKLDTPTPVEHSGVGISRDLAAPSTVTGQPLTITVHLADGQIEVRRG